MDREKWHQRKVRNMASIRDVAQLAGVSVGTVSRYLNGHQLKQLNREKIAAAIESLDYKENIIAKGLKNNRSYSFGLLMNRISSRFGSEVVSGIEKVAEENGYSILLSGFTNSKEYHDKLDYLLQHAVDGLIVFFSDEKKFDLLKWQDIQIPIVFLNHPETQGIADVLLLNDRQSVFDVINHYLAAGHKKIGYLSAPQSDHTARERLFGAQAAMANNEAEMKIVVGDYTRQSGYRGTEESEAEQSLLPQITVNPPAEKMGEKAAELVLERIKMGKAATEKQVVLMENQLLGLPKGAET